MYDWIEKNRWFYLVFAVIVFVFCMGVFCWQGIHNAKNHGTIDVAGMYGDSFGYVNALFSSLALVGIVLALFVQTMEFGLAARERSEVKRLQSSTTLVQTFTQHTQILNLAAFHAEVVLFEPLEQRKIVTLFRQRIALESLINALIQEESAKCELPIDSIHDRRTLDWKKREHQSGTLLEIANRLVTEFYIGFPDNESELQTYKNNLESFARSIAFAIEGLDTVDFNKRKWLQHHLDLANTARQNLPDYSHMVIERAGRKMMGGELNRVVAKYAQLALYLTMVAVEILGFRSKYPERQEGSQFDDRPIWEE